MLCACSHDTGRLLNRSLAQKHQLFRHSKIWWIWDTEEGNKAVLVRPAKVKGKREQTLHPNENKLNK